MVIDTSAILAIYFKEPERAQFLAVIEAAGTRLIPACCLTEICIVVTGRNGLEGLEAVRQLIAALDLNVVPINDVLAHRAADAFVDFGKGRHRAGLNFGDCFSYAVAKAAALPLLFKGGDFSLTDVAPAT